MKVSPAFTNFMYYQEINSGKKYGQELPSVFDKIRRSIR